MCDCTTLLGKQGSIEPYLPPSTQVSSVVASLQTTLDLPRPSASKYVRKNGPVLYMLSTRGMPTRMRLRFLAASSLERWKGRVIVSRFTRNSDLVTFTSSIGVPAAGCFAHS